MSDETTDDSSVFRLTESSGKGMSFRRYEEIAKADRDGIALEVGDEERIEFEEVRASMLGTISQLRESLTGTYKTMFEKLGVNGAPVERPRGTPAVDATRNAAIEATRRNAERIASYSGISQETLDSIAEARQEEHEREERNSENIELTTQVMRDMLTTMHEQALAAEARDKEARAAATRNYWVALGSLIFAALAVGAPFVIEAIKGWK